eukprot:CAMPEP_0172511918 /NCGR_PEP_ID=MMETSP1066-20121228/240343_1 /TAXON_ID=671091 /ORGANISM="Coscinodiscus wailesii, Strain CCMP2513" /LENGTH=370 /DNA_ID=CAMNT_0013291495 /DNA_START=19 /DNA_END=1128 /DNA_ORIENTATION=-
MNKVNIDKTEMSPPPIQADVDTDEPKFIIRIKNNGPSSNINNSSHKSMISDLTSVAEDSILTEDDVSVGTAPADASPGISQLRESLDLKRGHALKRSLANFRELDAQLLTELGNEIDRDLSAILPRLPETISPTSPPSEIAQHLTTYLSHLMQIPPIVRSDSLLHFLSTSRPPTTTTSSSSSTSSSCSSDPLSEHTHVEYLLPATLPLSPPEDDDAIRSYVTVPRKGHYTRSETIPHGWWIVWRVILPPDAVDLTYTIRMDSIVPDPTPRTVIHSETIVPGDEGVTGSYRHLPEETSFARCTFTLENGSFLRCGSADFAARVVSHKVFKAACAAARDQSRADERRRVAPLLARILDSRDVDPVRLEVLEG